VEWVAGNPAIMAALVIALAAAVTDARTRTIPNALVAAGALAGCLLNGWTSGAAGLTRAAVGCLAGFCVFLPFFLLRGMGGGDVKLMAALGSCLGPLPILQVALAAVWRAPRWRSWWRFGTASWRARCAAPATCWGRGSRAVRASRTS